MKKLLDLLKNRTPALVWAILFSALFAYALYSFRYEFLDWSNLPLVAFYAVLSGVCFAGAFCLTYTQYREKKGWAAFLAAFAAYQAILWVTLTLVNADGLYNRRAVAAAYAILLPLYGLFCFFALWKAAKKQLGIIHRSLAVLLCLGCCVGAAAPVLPSASDLYFAARYEENPSFADFEPLAEGEATQAADALAQTWLEQNLLQKKTDALSFTLDGVPFAETLPDWDFASEPGLARRGGKTTVLRGWHRKSGLILRVEATLYPGYGTCEWTGYLTNKGQGKSPVIAGLRALDADLPMGEPTVYAARGSHDDANDFTLLRLRRPEKLHRFTGTGGRPSDEYMPFFNLCGGSFGAVLAVGWTGQWAAELQKSDDGLRVSAGQESFEAYLLPGEEIRTPLVSLTFYGNEKKSPVQGFNVFRRWILDCVYPKNTPYVLNDLDVLFVSHTRTAAEIAADVEAYRNGWPEKMQTVDNFWMDAGWYAGCREGWGDGNGNWYTDDARFPGGLKAISGLAAENGSGLVVWFEPERLVHGSYLYGVGLAHPQWTVDLDPGNEENETVMWNLAEPDAAAFLADYIGNTIRDNGITVYRQDFNFEPLKFWEYADKAYYGGRTGICENRYVAGLYAYLDRLFELNPGLVMDNCASGGRRLDLEMTRRSIPLWRSDYNCAVRPDSLEANQSHTYNLSLWLPVSGVNVDLSSHYGAVSSIFGGNLFTIDSCASEFYGKFDDARAAMVKNYYPVTCAGVKPDGFTVMQFGDAQSGYLLIYKHDRAHGDLTVRLSGLEPNASYLLTPGYGETYDVSVHRRSGAQLTGEGLSFGYAADLGPVANVVKYEKE